MRRIKKAKLQNFKRFEALEIAFNNTKNILIGDNESGKSTILSALDLVISGSRARIENAGLEHIFNKNCIDGFMQSGRALTDLPILYVELYLDDLDDPHLNGRNNSENRECNGLRFECFPDDSLSREMAEILSQHEPTFPFEYYLFSFMTFSAEPYHSYKRFLNYINVDNSRIGSEYSLHEYVNGMYDRYSNPVEMCKHKNEYRKAKESFNKSALAELNEATGDFIFGVKNDSKSNLEGDLTLFEDGIPLEQKGKGRQCFIKTEFALNHTQRPIDVILLEEPENHLSHANMRKLVQKIEEANDPQLFIATHSNMICSRVDLRNAIMLSSTSERTVPFNDLSESTARFFMKSPDHSMLEFLLSSKVILVEGDAEYILTSAFFTKATGKSLDEAKVNVISVGGTSFARYLEIAKFLGIKTAVIRDNDGDPETNCRNRYTEYASDSIRVFFDFDSSRSTFEICIYRDNTSLCDALWLSERRSLSVEAFMLANKTQTAFEILERRSDDLVVPSYIKEALIWINE